MTALMTDEDLADAVILIVDDQRANVELLTRLLVRHGHYRNLVGLTDAREVLAHYQAGPPDLILLDLHMPHCDGFEVMTAIREVTPEGVFVPILVLTADITAQTKQRALAAGASDFLGKPFDPTEVLLRIRNLLRTHDLYVKQADQAKLLERRVQERTSDLEAAQIEMLERLARAAEYRDDTTGEHTFRVGQLSALVATRLGLAEPEVELIRRAARLHDVGKIGIPDSILLKPGRLTAAEVAVMRRHPGIGAELLSGGRSALLRVAEEIALSHHERFDGTGYPRGLAGDAVPLVGRIVSVVDVFDALTHARPYKPAWPVADALAEITRQCGRQFDPAVIAAFLDVWKT